MRDKMKGDAAGRVRKRLKAGRPTRITSEEVSVLDAVLRLVHEADRAQDMMRNEGLDPKDIRLALAHVQPEAGDIGFKLLPAPDKIGAFITAFEKLRANGSILFLGIIWDQRDRAAEANGQPGHNVWVTQWMAGPLAETQLRMLRDLVTHTQN